MLFIKQTTSNNNNGFLKVTEVVQALAHYVLLKALPPVCMKYTA